MRNQLSAVVKAIRLRYALPFVLLLGLVYWIGIHPWMANWGSTAAEQQMVLPGDHLHPDAAGQTTQAITINAPADGVWQWLVQIGQDRAGFYSYTWLENLIGVDIHNADTIHPEWQHLAVGDGWRMAPVDYLGGVGKNAVSKVLINDSGHALVLEIFGSIVIVPVDAQTSRLIMRGYSGPSNVLTTMVVDPIVFTMGKRMLLGLKARAEGQPDSPAALMAIAWLGWAAAGITVAGLFFKKPRRWVWLVLPVLAAFPALLTSRDIQAGFAAFIAVGITVLGFLIFGRNWWGSLLILGSVVLLTLLLAPEAFTAFGLAFILFLLAALGFTVAGRRSERLSSSRTEMAR
jgi:hypothetical protein